MTTLQTDTGITGAKRQSWRRANPRDVLKRLIDKNPDMTEEQLEHECWEIIHRDIQQMRTVYEYWFANNFRSLVRPAPSTPEARAERARQLQTKTGTLRRQVEQTIETRVKIALLEMLLPTGKQLRHSSREELLDLGGWASRVAEKLQPLQTVEQAGLSEAQLRTLYEGEANG